MSVVVRMEMPENCAVCPFVTEYSRCLFLGMYAIDEERRADNCPIVCQLPEGHGRLGDLDELAAGCDAPYWCRWLSEIEDAPTIVPAERREHETY